MPNAIIQIGITYNIQGGGTALVLNINYQNQTAVVWTNGASAPSVVPLASLS
jgi:hypothetical protein